MTTAEDEKKKKATRARVHFSHKRKYPYQRMSIVRPKTDFVPPPSASRLLAIDSRSPVNWYLRFRWS